MVVKTLVYAAEQVCQCEGCESEKLAYVQKHLADEDWALDMIAIEAAVREMNMESIWTVENAITIEDESESWTLTCLALSSRLSGYLTQL